MSVRRVVLLGGTGFVGRALARRLVRAVIHVRAVGRHPGRAEPVPAGVVAVRGDVHEVDALRPLLADSDAAVYLPGRVLGRTQAPFRLLHAIAAQNCARVARECGVKHFIYLSALGATDDALAWSDRTKAEGERLVTGAFPEAVVVRPSLVLGPEDHFSTEMIGLMQRLPLLPVIGPDTRVQPVHIDDLADALCTLLVNRPNAAGTVEAAGPTVWRLIELLAALRRMAGARCRLLPLPWLAARMLAIVASTLPGPPLCPDQVRLMRTDKTATGEHPGLPGLGVRPRDPLNRTGQDADPP